MGCVGRESFPQPGSGLALVQCMVFQTLGCFSSQQPTCLLLLHHLQMPGGFSVLSSRPSAKPGKASISLFFHSTEPVHGAYHRLKDTSWPFFKLRQSKYLPVLSFENGLPLCRDVYGTQQHLCLVRCLWGCGFSLEDFSFPCVDQVKLLSQFKMQWISLLAASAHVRSRYYSTTQPVKH